MLPVTSLGHLVFYIPYREHVKVLLMLSSSPQTSALFRLSLRPRHLSIRFVCIECMHVTCTLLVSFAYCNRISLFTATEERAAWTLATRTTAYDPTLHSASHDGGMQYQFSGLQEHLYACMFGRVMHPRLAQKRPLPSADPMLV